MKDDRRAPRPERKRLIGLPFLLFVCVPMVAVWLYFGLFASGQYLCESILSVQGQSVSSTADGIMERFGLMSPGRGNKDIYLVDEYVRSPAMLEILQDRHDLRAHYTGKRIDMLSRLGGGASWEDFVSYYNRKIRTRVNNENGFIYLSVRSYEPAYCKTLSGTILSEAETFVNNVSRKMQEDFLGFASEQLEKSEQDMTTAREALSRYQKEQNVLDPEKTAGSVMGIIARLEGEMAATQVDLADKLRVHNPSSPVIQAARSRQKALQKQIDQENARLTQGRRDGAMTETLAAYQTHLLQIDFARKRYEMALALWENAQAEALRKSLYIIPISDPRVPEDATGLNRMKEILGWSISVILAYALVSLLLLSVRDHIES